MAYNNRKFRNRKVGEESEYNVQLPRPPIRGGRSSSNIALAVSTSDGDYQCLTTKNYTQKSSIIQDLDTTDSFIKLSSFDKSLSTLTVHNAKVIVCKNISNIAIELAITTYDWKNDSDNTDVPNSVDVGGGGATKLRTWSMILPAQDFIFLPTSKVIGYTPSAGGTLESGANSTVGVVEIEPKDIYSGNEIKHVKLFSSTYGGGAFVLVDDGDATATSTELTVDDSDWFEVGDKLSINGTGGHEIVEVEGISGTTLTIKRALDGSIARVLANNSEIYYAFHNEHLAADNGKCQTDANGRFSQKGAFFGYGRSDDKVARGVVPGSVAIGPFYTRGGYLDWGLQDIKASDKTGLTAGTAYAFDLVVDEFNVGGLDSVTSKATISFTVDSSDTTWNGSSVAVIPKMQAAINDQFHLTASAIKNKKVSIRLIGGDIRIESHSNHSDTIIGIGDGASGTTTFGVGNFPPLVDTNVPDVKGQQVASQTDAIMYGPASSLGLEEIESAVSGRTIKNTREFILDDGKGNLLSEGNVVGSINYNKGHCNFRAKYANAEFKVYAETLSAHAGGNNFTLNANNGIEAISARAVNAKADAKIEMLLLG